MSQAGDSSQNSAGTAAPPNASPTRWSWNCYPNNRLDSTRMVLPLGCLHTPIAAPTYELNQDPLRCPCGAILNPYCAVDHRSKTWVCPLCQTRNTFPPQYASVLETQLPTEVYEQCSTIEYKLPRATHPAPTFALVIDTCVDTEEELAGLKESILIALSKMPENSKICLITFGATIQLHEINGATNYPRAIVMRGNSEVTVASIRAQVRNLDRVVSNFADAEFCITGVIEELTADPWPSPKGHRPLRCTGAAISAAASLLQVVSPNSGSMVLAFLSGVCTEGPGKVVDTSKITLIRHQADIRDGTSAASYVKSSTAFYEKIMGAMVSHGHSLNVFVACLDQIGLAEMKPCIQCSGGMILSAEVWSAPHFRESFNKFFKRNDHTGNLEMGLNATLDVITSPTWKVSGVIGPCVGTGKTSSSVSDVEMGQGGTCQWTASVIDRSTTFAVYFETHQPQNANAQQQLSGDRVVQFITTYESGTDMKIRVCTVKHQGQEKTNFQTLGAQFDQLTATVLLARLCVFKTETMSLFDVLRWLDRAVIRLVSRFGNYQKDQPNTLTLPPTFSLFPAFVYHLRRSACLQIFNSSPDETTILRLMLMKVNCEDAILMIQPALYSYSMDGAPCAVPLDSSAVDPSKILLLDTFYDVLVYHGDVIHSWIEQNYHLQPEYAHLAEFIQIPKAHAEALVAHRYPTPRLLIVNKKDGNVRIMHNRLNPSRTHNTDAERGTQGGELILTDDVSLSMFMDHLKKLAVKQE